jgi:hypothetical protein
LIMFIISYLRFFALVPVYLSGSKFSRCITRGTPAKGNRGGSLISPISAKQSTRSHFGSSLRPRPGEDQPRYRTFVSKSSTVPLSLIMKLRAMDCYNSKPNPSPNGSCFALCSIVPSLTLLFENNCTAPTRWILKSKSWQSSLSPIQVL